MSECYCVIMTALLEGDTCCWSSKTLRFWRMVRWKVTSRAETSIASRSVRIAAWTEAQKRGTSKWQCLGNNPVRVLSIDRGEGRVGGGGWWSEGVRECGSEGVRE